MDKATAQKALDAAKLALTNAKTDDEKEDAQEAVTKAQADFDSATA